MPHRTPADQRKADQTLPMAEQRRFAVHAVQRLRAGDLVAVPSLTSALLGGYVEVLQDWQDCLVAAQQAPDAIDASIREAMEAYWIALRARPELADLVAAVNQAEVEALAADNGEAPPADEALLAELATLPLLDYGRRRKEAAGQLGIPVGLLDEVIKSRRGQPGTPAGQGHAIIFDDDGEAPWAEPVDGAALLGEIAATLARYLSLPAGAADAMALWVLHTHAMESWSISPVLALISPQPGCGKTTALQIVAGLARRALPASNIKGAAIFRVVERYHPTLILDEVDTYLTDEHDDIRGIVNSGHSRGTAYVIRAVGDECEPRRFSTWAAKAIALIGRLPATIADRSIRIGMQRRRPGEHLARWRLDHRDTLAPLRRQAQRWAADHLEALARRDPSIPEPLQDRAADNWRPLLAIAECAGGAWPQRADQALTALEAVDTARNKDASLQLLEDLYRIYEDRGTDRIASAELCEALGAIEDRPWADWRQGKGMTPHQVAKLLAPYGIQPTTIRLADGRTPKGYLRESCEDTFSRYLPFQTATPPQGTTGADPQAKSIRNTPGHVAVSKMPESRV